MCVRISYLLSNIFLHRNNSFVKKLVYYFLPELINVSYHQIYQVNSCCQVEKVKYGTISVKNEYNMELLFLQHYGIAIRNCGFPLLAKYVRTPIRNG